MLAAVRPSRFLRGWTEESWRRGEPGARTSSRTASWWWRRRSTQVIDQVLDDRAIRPVAVCLGIAGVDRDDDAATIRGVMRRLGFREHTLIVNDALIALVAGAGEPVGLVIVAGTGRSPTA